MPSAMCSCSRGARRLCFGAAVVAAALTWSKAGRAQTDTSRSGTAQPTAGAQAPTSQSTKTVPDLHLQSLATDPCKAKNPPAYCAKK
jgi:hypothetical protein